MAAETDPLKTVLYRSKEDKVVNILVAVTVLMCTVWWSPGSVIGKTLVLALLVAGGVVSPLAHAFLPYALLRTEKVVVRNDWRHYAVPTTDLVGTETKPRRLTGSARNVALPVLTTRSGKVVLSGAR